MFHEFIRIIPRFLDFWMDLFLTPPFPPPKKILDSRSSSWIHHFFQPWVFWCHQVEIEYFLALMAQLPVGSDLPETAKTKLREIPAKLTIENAKDERTGKPEGTSLRSLMVSSMFFTPKSRWRVHDEFLILFLWGSSDWMKYLLLAGFGAETETKTQFYDWLLIIVSKLRDP